MILEQGTGPLPREQPGSIGPHSGDRVNELYNSRVVGDLWSLAARSPILEGLLD